MFQNGTRMSIDPTITKRIITKMNSIISAENRGFVIEQQQYFVKTNDIISTLRGTVIHCRVNAISLSLETLIN